MYLKRLEIFGFKTFASRTVIEFPAGITAVVGPNGSGKSNVTDAIRWVLGEQSFSALRCRRTEDLIFSGGAKRAPLGLAEVSLTIDNSDRTLALPFDEVTLMRRSHRSGENEYFINKSKVRLRDLQEAVAPLGQSYTLVNQGMVDAALSLRPDERRSLFEDAAEISLSVSRRADSERRLKQTETNLGRLYDLMAELEPRLRSLKRQAREAEQVHELEAELQGALQHQFLYQWQQTLVHQAHAHTQVEQLQTRLAEQKQHQTELQTNLAERQTALQQAVEALEQHSISLSQAERESDITERSYAVLQERYKALEARQNEIHQRLQTAAQEQQTMERDLDKAQEQRSQAQTKVVEREQALAKLETQEQDRIQARLAAQAATTQARQAAFQAAAEVNKIRNTYEQNQTRLTTLATELATIESELANVLEHIEQHQVEHAQALQALEQADSALNTLAQTEQTARESLVKARQDRTSIEDRLAQQRRTVDSLQSRLDALRRTVASGAGMFSGVKAAMNWATEKGISDAALVASIIQVPAELETALEVTLGGRLQNIVVKQWDTAEAAIQFLKHSNAGRATFLPLDTLRTSSPQPAPAGAGIVGVASDLVTFEPQYEQVVHYLLGRVLVVKDLATARQVVRAGGNWSIVTISGEQVNASGAMTGGGSVRESGTLRRERELRELPQHLTTAQAELTTHEQQLAQTVAAIKAAEQELQSLEHTRREARQRLEQTQDHVAQCTRKLERLEQDREWHINRRETLLREQHTTQTAQAEITKALEAAQQAEHHAQTELTAAEQAEQQTQQAAQASEQRILTARTEVAQQQAELKTQTQQVTALEQRLSQLQAEYERLSHQQSSLQTEHTNVAQQADQLEATLQTQQVHVRTLAEHHTPLLSTRDNARQQVHELETNERALTARLLATQTELGRAETTLAQIEARRNQIWERCAEEEIDIESLATEQHTYQEPSTEQLERIETLRQRLRRMGTINPLAPQEYIELQDRHSFLETQIKDVEQAAQRLRDLIDELEQAMNERFAETFSAVAEVFQQTFARLFGGGEAQLLLDEATQGIEIIAQPPGKRRQPLSLLSGGERSLTAVALLMALLQVNPTPFCVMDEVDAALDEANVVRFRELLVELSAQTQFVIVTHNRGTVEVASTLYGVTMQADGASQVLSLRMDDFIEESVNDVTYVSTNL